MLYTDRIKNLTAAYPKLSRVWIKTENSKLPLKSVWIDESRLPRDTQETGTSHVENSAAEITDDHLLLAA